jgi:hypothetical protein
MKAALKKQMQAEAEEVTKNIKESSYRAGELLVESVDSRIKPSTVIAFEKPFRVVDKVKERAEHFRKYYALVESFHHQKEAGQVVWLRQTVNSKNESFQVPHRPRKN